MKTYHISYLKVVKCLTLETNSIERTKAGSRKVASESSKVSTMIINDTYSVPKSIHISPNPANRARNVDVISRNKKHHVSQEKQGSVNTFQSKILINTINNNRPNYNMVKQYIKRMNPNFIVSTHSKSKYLIFN